MDELKRCPFCGMIPRTEVTATRFSWDEYHIDFSVRCAACSIGKTVRLKITKSVEFSDVDKAKILAINAWNQSVNVIKNREELAQMCCGSADTS